MQQPSVGVSVDPLKGRIRNADIKQIAGELPNWQLVATELGMRYQDIKDIETNRTPAEQGVAFLNKWIFRDETAATYEKLIEVLMSLGEQGAAEHLATLGQRPPMQQPPVGVSDDPLRGKIRNADINKIAGELPNWQLVATKLGMGNQVIEGIETNHRAPEDQRMSFLNQWIKNRGTAATYETLIEALKSLGQQGAAERIERICKQGQKPPSQPEPPSQQQQPPSQPQPDAILGLWPPMQQPSVRAPIGPSLDPLRDSTPSEGLISDCSLSRWEDVSKEGQPPAFWNLDSLSWPLQLNGEGIVIAILDSGINQNHLAFTQQVHLAQSFIPGESVEDTLGHGTMCAGIACGARFEGSEQFNWFGGIAPRAKLVVCKVVPNGSNVCNPTAMCKALDYIKSNHGVNSELPVNVISLSFGSLNYDSEICDRVNALATDVIFVCAASNYGRQTDQPIAYPARLGNVLCIGSHSSSGRASSFSAVGREIDFLAPGENVCAPFVGVPQALSSGSGTSYSTPADALFFGSGTSFSTPAVAGLICLVLQYLKQHLSPTLYHRACKEVVMKRILQKKMATHQGGHSEEHGYGCLVPKEFFDIIPAEIERFIGKI